MTKKNSNLLILFIFQTGKEQLSLTGGHKSYYWTHDFFRIYNYNQTLKIIESVIPKENIFVYPMEEVVEKKNINCLFNYLYYISNSSKKKLLPVKDEKILNTSNKSRAFFFIYNIISRLNIDPKKLNKKIKYLVDYKKILRNFKSKFNIDEKYKKEIKEYFLKDNEELINSYKKIKEYQNHYNFKE